MNRKVISIYIVLITFILLFLVQPYFGIWGMLPISFVGVYLYNKTKEKI